MKSYLAVALVVCFVAAVSCEPNPSQRWRRLAPMDLEQTPYYSDQPSLLVEPTRFRRQLHYPVYHPPPPSSGGTMRA